jgi:hypothetical protein
MRLKKVKMTHIIFYISTMPCEIGAAALLSCVSSAIVAIPMTINDAKSDAGLQIIKKYAQRGNSLIFLGSYWNSIIPQIASTSTVHTHLPGEIPAGFAGTVVSANASGIGPAAFVAKYALENFNSTSIKYFLESHKKVIELLDDRFFNRNIVDNQIFFSGLYNYPSENNLGNFERFIDLFEGKVQLEELMKIGKVISDAQQNMARERAVKNSKHITLSDGTKAVVTDAPELINLTHDEMHKLHGTDVTINISYRFSDKSEDQISFSIRSYNTAINAEAIAKRINNESGGSREAAGGRVTAKLPLNL